MAASRKARPFFISGAIKERAIAKPTIHLSDRRAILITAEA